MNNSVLTATTAPKKLSLADWLAIAETLNYERLWGFDAFIKHSSPETYDLTVLTIKDWEDLVASALAFLMDGRQLVSGKQFSNSIRSSS